MSNRLDQRIIMKIGLSKMELITGVPKRTLQNWDLKSVIKCVPETQNTGTGKSRLYTEKEIAIALILVNLSNPSLPVHRLAVMAEDIRLILSIEPELNGRDFREANEKLDADWNIWCESSPKVPNTPDSEEWKQYYDLQPNLIRVCWIYLNAAMQGEQLNDQVSIFRLTFDENGKLDIFIDGYKPGQQISLFEIPEKSVTTMHVNLQNVLLPLSILKSDFE
jgi:hypothetical protein